MNFEMAGDMAVEMASRQIIVNDDVAVRDSLYTTGLAGVAGTISSIAAVAKAEQGTCWP